MRGGENLEKHLTSEVASYLSFSFTKSDSKRSPMQSNRLVAELSASIMRLRQA